MEFTAQDAKRFWAKVDKDSDPNGCWLWRACLATGGYGKFFVKPRLYRSHRVTWELSNGPIPDGLCVLHNCPGGDNRACVNPAHLWLGTREENQADMALKGRSASGDRDAARAHPECVPRGEKHCYAKLTERQVLEVARRYPTSGLSMEKLGAEYGVGASTVCDITHRKRWKHLHFEESKEAHEVCSVENCNDIVWCRGWCSMHYRRWRRNENARKT